MRANVEVTREAYLMIPCPVCGKMVSASALVCPNCAHPLRRAPMSPSVRISLLVASVLLFVIGCGLEVSGIDAIMTTRTPAISVRDSDDPSTREAENATNAFAQQIGSVGGAGVCVVGVLFMIPLGVFAVSTVRRRP